MMAEGVEKHDNAINSERGPRGLTWRIYRNLRTINAQLLTHCFDCSWVASGRMLFSILPPRFSCPPLRCSPPLSIVCPVPRALFAMLAIYSATSPPADNVYCHSFLHWNFRTAELHSFFLFLFRSPLFLNFLSLAS